MKVGVGRCNFLPLFPWQHPPRNRLYPQLNKNDECTTSTAERRLERTDRSVAFRASPCGYPHRQQGRCPTCATSRATRWAVSAPFSAVGESTSAIDSRHGLVAHDDGCGEEMGWRDLNNARGSAHFVRRPSVSFKSSDVHICCSRICSQQRYGVGGHSPSPFWE